MYRVHYELNQQPLTILCDHHQFQLDKYIQNSFNTVFKTSQLFSLNAVILYPVHPNATLQTTEESCRTRNYQVTKTQATIYCMQLQTS